MNIFTYQINHIVPNARFELYRTMTLEQVIFLIVFVLVSYPLYFVNKKLTGKLVNRLLFSNREFKDE